MVLVVDASVACKWFSAEDGAEAAERLLSLGEPLIAPDLIVAEVCNVAWKKMRRGQMTAPQTQAMVEALPGFLDELAPGTLLAGRALAIATELNLSAYDCFYLALAERREARLVTADIRLRDRAVAVRAVQVILLGEAIQP
jgi:predicted nucleic acid-binding protein